MEKILIVANSLSGGGAERVATILASGLCKRNYEVYFAYFYDAKKNYNISEDVRLVKINAYKTNCNRIKAIFKRLSDLRKAIKTIEPDYVLPFLYDFQVYFASKYLKVNFLTNIRVNPRVFSKSKIKLFFRDRACKKSNAILVQNNEQKEYFSKKMQKKVFIMPNPVDASFLNVDKKYNNRIESIVSTGRLDDNQKNFKLIFDAFKVLHEKYDYLNLYIYGEGPSKNMYEEYLKQNNINNVFLCGRVENVAECLKKHDLFVMSSNFEGQPNSLLEACAVGLPCISTNCPTGPKEIIAHGINGLLIDVNNKDQLISAMEKLINNNELAIKMGENAKKSIKENYSLEKTLNSLENALKYIKVRK